MHGENNFLEHCRNFNQKHSKCIFGFKTILWSKFLLKFTVFLRSLVYFYTASNYLKRDKTFWTYNTAVLYNVKCTLKWIRLALSENWMMILTRGRATFYWYFFSRKVKVLSAPCYVSNFLVGRSTLFGNNIRDTQ